MVSLSTKIILFAVLIAEILALALLYLGVDWRHAPILAAATVMTLLLVYLFSPKIWRLLRHLLTVWRRPKFSLRTLFLFTAFSALLLGTLGRDAGRTHQELTTVRQLEALGAEVAYDTEMADAVSIRRDRDAPPLTWSRKLLQVPGTHVTYVAMSPGYVHKNLRNSNITDNEMTHLRGFSEIQMLDLRGTMVTDHGLTNLHHLRHLKYVIVSGWRITEEGIDELRQALPNCEVYRQQGPGLTSAKKLEAEIRKSRESKR